MKKFLSLLLTAVLLLSLTACGGETERSLCDQGLDVVALMEEAMESDAYLDLLSASEPLRSVISEAASGDYSTPAAVYSISFPGGLAEDPALSGELLELARHRLYNAVISQVNAMAGAQTLAAATMCTVGKTFVSTELTEDVIYLYVYENGCPMAVTFTTGEDNTVNASGNVILYDDFPCGSAEEIAAFFGNDGVRVALVQP